MAFGLEIWNAAGQKTLSYADRLSRIHLHYNYSIPSGVTELPVGVVGLAKDGTWAVFVLELSTSWSGVNGVVPVITPNVVTLKRQLGSGSVANGTLLVYRI